MNRKQFLIALGVLVVLAAAGAAVVFSDRSAWTSTDSRAGQKVLAGLKISEVAEIAIKDSSGELHLVRARPAGPCASAPISPPTPIASLRCW
ncbi:MAG TPA: hypothetical protein VK572_14345 [Burkholderiales bacterium]|nr:hypothetical protein [Burkholderiales bacterium]